ncbi:MAG: hypothetical protein JRE61_04565 [Deltaproteobacteria bacterium]|jgi:YHS domain-containing protein|nr:hypothetical protein [Deltaproteobacteria bacterium]
MRLLILLGIVYLCYRFLKSWILKEPSSHQTVSGKKAGEIDNVMVKDPYCGVYFARKDGVDLKIDGQDLYFCSQECRDNFVENHSKN